MKEFTFFLKKQRFDGESKDKYLMKTTKKEITKREAIQLLQREKWGSFNGYVFRYKNKKYCYGMREFSTFDNLLNEIAKHSKRNGISFGVYQSVAKR